MKTTKRSGFSLVELMLVAVIMSVLVLIFGSTFYFVHKGWQQNLAVVELQRTAYLTMREIATEIRHSETATATSTTITLGPDTRAPAGDRTITLSEEIGLTLQKNGTNRTLIKPEFIDAANSQFEELTINGEITIQIELNLYDDFAGTSTINRYIINERN
jgi:prepilin-type N-terminal cleavage/methylation domain-containing protein